MKSVGAPVVVTGASLEPTRTPAIWTLGLAASTPSICLICSVRELSMGWVSRDFDELSSPLPASLGPWTYRSEVMVDEVSLEKVSDMEARRASVPDRNATPSMTAKVVRKNCLAWARTERQATRLTAQAPSAAELAL